MNILQISDLHIDVSSNINDCNNKMKILFNALAKILPKDEDLVFCFLGDLINMGAGDCFIVLKQFFDELLDLYKDYNLHVEFVPGNHDLCENADGEKSLDCYNDFISQYAPYSYQPDQSVHIKEYEDIILVLTSSISHNDHTFGSIDFIQLKNKIEKLEKPFIVLTHHALISAYDSDTSAIRNAAKLTSLMKSKYFIGFLHGHTHGYEDIRIENCQIIGVGPFLKDIPNVNNQLNLIGINNGEIYTVDNYYYRADFRHVGQYISAPVFKWESSSYMGNSVYEVYEKILHELRYLHYSYNMSINIKLSLKKFETEIEEHFRPYLNDSANMLKSVPPNTMKYNHGEYLVTKDGLTGVDYIIKHLKTSPNSVRALLPLIDFNEVVATSNDVNRDNLPSLNIIQFSLDRNDSSILNLTMYFRSLEVNYYLNINLCEAYLLAAKIAEQIQSIKSLNLTIHAFVAQYYTGGYKLGNKVSQIDMMTSEELTIYLVEHQYTELAKLFEEKRNDHNYADINSIQNFSKALNAVKTRSGFPSNITTAFQELEQQIKDYIPFKSSRSIFLDVEKQERNIERQMDEFINILRKM